MLRLFLLAVAALVAFHVDVAAAEDLGIRVPKGFEVSLYADDTLAHDIYSMTVDAKGRVVVAGAGYVKILEDTNADGTADRATLFSDIPKSGAHGMIFDGPDLICTGDNSVMRLRDTDGDGKADGKPEVWTNLRHPEHGANGITRGPDGCFYVICGNDSGLSEKHAVLANSPVKHPRCGGIVRFSPGGGVLDVYAHGFRNPYDLDFDAQGHLLTVDADGERDHHLPWYAPNRLFDVAQGMEHGWMLPGWVRSWNRPASFFDNVERMNEIGRGSPTGVVAYRHRQFPEHYRGGVFSACWTFGRVYYFRLEKAGATCRTKLETFMETTGDVGFAPCDLAVGLEGDLFVAIGGRRTRGSVFRVRYQDAAKTAASQYPLEQVLKADQPQSSWSRARWLPLARKLGGKPFEEAAGNGKLTTAERIRAIEVLVDLFGIDPVLAERLAGDDDAAVRARVGWALSREAFSPKAGEILCRLTSDDDASVARAAWEALAVCPQIDAQSPVQPDWSKGLSTLNRRVRSIAIAVARASGSESYQNFASRIRVAANAWPLRLAQLRIALPENPVTDSLREPSPQLTSIVEVFTGATDPAIKLEAVRLLQIGLGDLRLQEGQAEVYSGYVGNATGTLDPKLRETLVAALAPAFPAGDAELDRELARLLGLLSASYAGLPAASAAKCTATSSVDDDVHYLIVASLLEGERTPEVTAATGSALLALQAKLDAAGQFASRNWPLRVAETFDALCRRDSALAAAIAGSPALNHAGHALFVERLPEKLRQSATRKLWAATVGAGQEPTSELIALAGRLPAAEALPLVRSQWDFGGVRDVITVVLAKHPEPADRAKFIEALGSTQPEIVEQAVRALVGLGIDHTPAEMAAVLRALKQACGLKGRDEPRISLVRLLEFWTEDGADLDWPDDPSQLYVPWFEMFAQYYPAEAAKLKATSGADAATWKKRLAALDWTAGDAERGRAAFELRACHRCHEVTGHLGPELKGAITRLSRDDLFTAILDPSLEVSPAYLTTAVATNSGQVYHGLIVYESPESILLQTGPDTTVRITNTDTAAVRPSTQSLMPTGLLDQFTDQDLRDLYAYLKSLATNPATDKSKKD